MWDSSRAIHFEWPGLFGYHLNITELDLTPGAVAARVYPDSPENVWAGDKGEPKTIHVFPDDLADYDGTYTPVANPRWTPETGVYSTVFLLFADENEARAALPHLWNDAN
jgi:hypothetical protein